jgi:multidrug efflux pump
MAFFPGSVGIIYRQFSVTMAAAISLSAFLALSLTPALCASLLKPVAAGHHHARKGLFGWFNRSMEKAKTTYSGIIRWTLLRAGRLMLVYLAMVIGLAWGFARLPTGFLPIDDQAHHHRRANPPEAVQPDLDVVKQVEEFSTEKASISYISDPAFWPPEYSEAFVTLKDWSDVARVSRPSYCGGHQQDIGGHQGRQDFR